MNKQISHTSSIGGMKEDISLQTPQTLKVWEKTARDSSMHLNLAIGWNERNVLSKRKNTLSELSQEEINDLNGPVAF